MSGILEKYYRINPATGISMVIHQNATIEMNVCQISAKGDELSFDKKIANVSSFEELGRHVAAGSNIALNISGKGVLIKQIDKAELISAANFKEILPNAKFDDFYVQNFISGELSYVAVIRKAEADKLMDLVRGLKVSVLSLSLGPFVVQHIIPQLNLYNNNLVFDGNAVVLKDDGIWSNYRYVHDLKSDFPLKIEIEKIDEKLLIPYAAAFQLLLSQKLDKIQIDDAGITRAFDIKIETIKSKVLGSIILSAFFLALLINFITFSSLNASNSELSERVYQTIQNSSDIDMINKQINAKETLLNNLGWEPGVRKSLLIDQVMALLPLNVKLVSVAVDPVDPVLSRNNKTQTFKNRQILINGTSDKIISVNEWMVRMKTKDWVKHVRLNSYNYNTEENMGDFSVLIDY